MFSCIALSLTLFVAKILKYPEQDILIVNSDFIVN